MNARSALPAPPSGDTIRVEKRGGAPVADANVPNTGAALDPDAIRFRVSNEDVDAFGDVVVQSGLEFPPALPAVADHSHSLHAAIGDWQNVERGNRETFATLRLLPRGVSRSADLVRALHDGGFPLASSIYFSTKRGDVEPITKTEPRRQAAPDGRALSARQGPRNHVDAIPSEPGGRGRRALARIQ